MRRRGRRKHGKQVRGQIGEQKRGQSREVCSMRCNLIHHSRKRWQFRIDFESVEALAMAASRRRTHRLAGAGRNSDLVLASQSEHASIFRHLTQQFQPFERSVAGNVEILRRGRRRMHHGQQRLKLRRDRLQRTYRQEERMQTRRKECDISEMLMSDEVRYSRTGRALDGGWDRTA